MPEKGVLLSSALSILHITDFHISCPLPNGFERRIERAVEASKSAIDSERLYIVVSGDIASSGKAEEYDEATKFFACLSSTIRERLKATVELVMVPGNHDVNNPPKSIPKKRGAAGWDEQLSKMDDYFRFACRMDAGWDDKGVLVVSRPLPAESGFTGLRFCCLNTAPFSTRLSTRS